MRFTATNQDGQKKGRRDLGYKKGGEAESRVPSKDAPDETHHGKAGVAFGARYSHYKHAGLLQLASCPRVLLWRRVLPPAMPRSPFLLLPPSSSVLALPLLPLPARARRLAAARLLLSRSSLLPCRVLPSCSSLLPPPSFVLKNGGLCCLVLRM